MAVKFYGKCTGDEADNYELWLLVREDYRNKELNIINVSVGFYIKTKGLIENGVNDTTRQSHIALIVDGNNVVDKDVVFDISRRETFLIASWKGDCNIVDGDLVLPLKGTLTVTGDNPNSGEVDFVYKNTLNPRASGVTTNSQTVNPGEIVTAKIETASSEYTHKIEWSLGEAGVTLDYTGGVTDIEFAVPVEWAEQIKNSRTGDMKITIKTYDASALVGTNIYTLSFVVPATDVFKPDYEISLQKYDTVIPDDWCEWVQGVSQLRVVPENLVFKYGATLAAVTITVGSVSKRTIPAVFELPGSGTTTITLAIRDSRGLLTVKTATIDVREYNAPSIDVRGLVRCLADGTINSSGENLFMDYVVGFSPVNSKNHYTIKIKYRPTDNEEFSDECNVSARPAVFGDGNIKNNKSYVVSIKISDEINSSGVEIVRLIPNGDIPFNIRKGGNGAAFGKYAKNENELSVKWDLSVEGNLNFAGAINYENVVAGCMPVTRDLFADLRYYPCLNAVFVRMRLVTTMELAANHTYRIAYVEERIPGIFTPLNCLAEFNSGGQSTSGITYETGMVVFRSDVAVPEGTTIYISGFYIADFKT